MTRLWYLFTAGSRDEQLANGYMKVKPVKTKQTKKKKDLMRKYGNEANIHLMSVQAIHTYKQRKGPLTGDNSPEHHFAACKIEISISRRLDS